MDLKVSGWPKNFVRADIHHLPFKSKSFSEVRCFNVLEHTGVNVIEASKELLRVSSYQVVIEVPGFLALRVHPKVHKDHARLFTARFLKRLFARFPYKLTVCHSGFMFQFPPLFYVAFRYRIVVWRR